MHYFHIRTVIPDMNTKLFVLTNRLLPPVYPNGYIPLYLGTGWEHTADALYEDT